MDWVNLFNGFHGRIGRQTFWIGVVVLVVAEIVGDVAAQLVEGDRLGAIVDLAFVYPELAVAIKRAHDRDLPVWLLGIFFGAAVVLDLLTVLGWSGNAEAPSMLSLAIAVPFTVLGLALLIELGFRRGTVGPNQYGPDPLASA